jgi:hypothetical protein
LQIETQLEIFRQIRGELDEQRQIMQTDVFEILASKLIYADAKIKGLVENRTLELESNNQRVKLLHKRQRAIFLFRKSSLDEAIMDVELWQQLSFNPLWFATMKAQTQQFSKVLDRAKGSSLNEENEVIKATIAVRNPLRDINSARVFLPSEKLESARTSEIAFTSAKLIQIDDKWRLIDPVPDLSKDTVRELAVRLKRANPSTFGLLTSLGAVCSKKDNTFSIVFRIPDNMSKPETLRAKIMASDTNHSLSERFRLARQLARAVFSVHTFDMVHKSIRPDNIIMLRDAESTLGSAFLLGFERVRREEDETRLSGDADWAKNLYRHPQRQGSRIRERYVMQHDIYSLGVCLLEIGLWSSLVETRQNWSSVAPLTHRFRGENANDLDYTEHIKSSLLRLATRELPSKMGTKYAKIVESCLTCLDLGNEDFIEDSDLQEDDAIVAVGYINKVSIHDNKGLIQ